MIDVYLLLGTNLGNREANLEFALNEIEERAGNIMVESKIYSSKAWGFQSENSFLNRAVRVRTNLESEILLEVLKSIETMTGRESRGDGYQDREIDIDILFYGNEVINNEKLVIPHPRLHLRNFTLIPLAEIAPRFIHPVFHQTIRSLLLDCEDEGLVKVYKA